MLPALALMTGGKQTNLPALPAHSGKVILALLGAGGLYLGYRWVKRQGELREAAKGLNTNSPSSFASRIRLAISGPGTNEPALRAIITKIPSREFFRAVSASYQKKYGSSMVLDLEGDLSSSEYREMLFILEGKPEKTGSNQITGKMLSAWAKRIRMAVEYRYFGVPGTDEDALFQVFQEVPSRQVATAVGLTYQKLFGEELMQRLRSELNSSEQAQLRQIYLSKP